MGTYTELSADNAGQASDLMKAVNSIPAYVEKCSHFFTICPAVTHRDMPNAMCDFGSWLGRGWCRVEMFALLLARHSRIPAIIVQGGDGTPYMIRRVVSFCLAQWNRVVFFQILFLTSVGRCQCCHIVGRMLWLIDMTSSHCVCLCSRSPTEVLPRAPGLGTFTCCSREHIMTNANGVEQAIPCDKSKVGGVVYQMVEKRREYYLGSGDLLRFSDVERMGSQLHAGTVPQRHGATTHDSGGVPCRIPIRQPA